MGYMAKDTGSGCVAYGVCSSSSQLIYASSFPLRKHSTSSKNRKVLPQISSSYNIVHSKIKSIRLPSHPNRLFLLPLLPQNRLFKSFNSPLPLLDHLPTSSSSLD